MFFLGVSPDSAKLNTLQGVEKMEIESNPIEKTKEKKDRYARYMEVSDIDFLIESKKAM